MPSASTSNRPRGGEIDADGLYRMKRKTVVLMAGNGYNSVMIGIRSGSYFRIAKQPDLTIYALFPNMFCGRVCFFLE
jgi:hypothetical protein